MYSSKVPLATLRRTVRTWPGMAALRKMSTCTLPDRVVRVRARGFFSRSVPAGSSTHIGMVFPARLNMVNGRIPCSWNHT